MDTRLGALLVGCVIGFILGYIVRSLREIKAKVEKVDEHIMNTKPHGDDGFTTPGWLQNIALLVVVAITAWSAFASQHNSNTISSQSDSIQSQQDASDKLVACNQQYLAATIAALNARTTFSQEQSAANVSLQKSLSNLVTLSLRTPPLGPEAARRVVVGFSDALKHFLDLSAKSADKVSENPYPTATGLLDCIHKK